MQKKLYLAIALSWSVLLQACGQSGGSAYALMLKGLYSHTVPVIKPTELKKQLQQKNPPLLLDTRTTAEYNVSHLQGAKLAVYENFEAVALKDIPKNTQLIVYCSVGYRSEKVGEKLLAAGFTEVQNLYGGIFEWVNNGFLVYNSKGATSKVHAYSKSWGVWLKKGEKVYGSE